MGEMGQRCKFLLEQLIKFRINDMLLDLESGYRTQKDYENLTELIMGVTRYVNDIRYCSKVGCPCSPEYKVQTYYGKTKHFLKGTNTALHPIPWKTIENIVKGLEE